MKRSPYTPQTVKINGKTATIVKESEWEWSGYFNEDKEYCNIYRSYSADTKDSLLYTMGYRPRRKKRVQRIPETEKFQELKKKSDELGETNDCSVISLSVVTGESYEDAHAALELAGRKARDGVIHTTMVKAADILGYRLVKFEKPSNLKTVRNAEEVLGNGRYLFDISCHYAAMSDGQVHDWTRGRCHRVQDVYTVEKV